MRHIPRRRAGAALTEAIVAATLLLLVVQVSWWVTAVQSVVATRVVAGARVLDETRLIHHVLASEVGQGRAGVDWEVHDGELHLRAFRGTGFRCHTQPLDGLGVAVSGHREPDPDKDSVLVLTPDGKWTAAALAQRRRNARLDCQTMAGFRTEVWRLDPPQPEALVGAYFERGAYRFSDGAFRYRRGNGGWQPLTGTGIVADSAGMAPAGTDAVSARVTWEGSNPLPPSFDWTLWGLR